MVDLERRSFEGTAGNMEEFEREVFIPSKKPQILTSLTRKLLICKENWLNIQHGYVLQLTSQPVIYKKLFELNFK